jgi:hypothetical protein
MHCSKATRQQGRGSPAQGRSSGDDIIDQENLPRRSIPGLAPDHKARAWQTQPLGTAAAGLTPQAPPAQHAAEGRAQVEGEPPREEPRGRPSAAQRVHGMRGDPGDRIDGTQPRPTGQALQHSLCKRSCQLVPPSVLECENSCAQGAAILSPDDSRGLGRRRSVTVEADRARLVAEPAAQGTRRAPQRHHP